MKRSRSGKNGAAGIARRFPQKDTRGYFRERKLAARRCTASGTSSPLRTLHSTRFKASDYRPCSVTRRPRSRDRLRRTSRSDVSRCLGRISATSVSSDPSNGFTRYIFFPGISPFAIDRGTCARRSARWQGRGEGGRIAIARFLFKSRRRSCRMAAKPFIPTKRGEE